jgi:Chitobiase/beta-hexosaminidase C-terminal domain
MGGVMKKITLWFNVLAAIIAVTILQACASTAGLTQCATPKLNPSGGSGQAGSSIRVTISTATLGAKLRYTTDGSKPTSTYGTLIAAESGSAPVPCVFGRTLKLQAIAFKPGLTPSDIAVGYYTASH